MPDGYSTLFSIACDPTRNPHLEGYDQKVFDQLGTVNFYDPTASLRVVELLPTALQALGLDSVRAAIGTLRV